MTDFPITQVLVLFAAGFIGTIAVMPYAFALNKDQLEKTPLSKPALVAVSVLQSAVLIAIATVVGSLLTREIGLSAPVIEAAIAQENVLQAVQEIAPIAILVGILAASITLGVEAIVFYPRLPKALRERSQDLPLWKRALATLYGGITEELLVRWFIMSLAAWLLRFVWQTPEGLPTAGAFWLAAILAALLFGLGHLPATKAITPLTSMLIIRAIVLNGIVGIAAGWLFWQYGIEAAMIAHFIADVMLHIFGPMVVKSDKPKPEMIAVSQS